MTAVELLARPTYVEEFENIRDNVNLAIKPRENEGAADVIDDNWENVSHYSRRRYSKEQKSNAS